MKSAITDAYCSLTEAYIRGKSHEELVQMIISVINMPVKRCEEHYGYCLLMDDIADKLRGRE